MAAKQLSVDGSVMTDEDLQSALDALGTGNEGKDVEELLKIMNEQRMISWEEAELIIRTSGPNEVVKSGLPEHVRPSEPENETDVEECTQRLLQNDPSLQEINLNNMKRTPIPQLQRLIGASRDNTYLKKISLANVGLTDTGAEVSLIFGVLIEVLQHNTTLKSINLETNFLSGEFLAKLLQAALMHQTLEELKAVNQSMNFHTQAERDIIEAINANRGLTKVSIQLRLPEGRHKIENALIRNGEIRRLIRKKKAKEMAERGGSQPSFTAALPSDKEKIAPAAAKDKAGAKEKAAPPRKEPLAAKKDAAAPAKQRAAQEKPLPSTDGKATAAKQRAAPSAAQEKPPVSSTGGKTAGVKQRAAQEKPPVSSTGEKTAGVKQRAAQEKPASSTGEKASAASGGKAAHHGNPSVAAGKSPAAAAEKAVANAEKAAHSAAPPHEAPVQAKPAPTKASYREVANAAAAAALARHKKM